MTANPMIDVHKCPNDLNKPATNTSLIFSLCWNIFYVAIESPAMKVHSLL